MKTFAEALKARREAAGLTRMALAKAVGVRPCSITFYEQGKSSPAWATLQKIADALGVATEDLRDRPAKGAEPEQGKK